MKKKYRLLKFKEFSDVLKTGNKIFSTSLVCYWKFYPHLPNIKIGLIIPKKKIKLSCNRKYLKRLFWSINVSQNMFLFPKIKCVILFRDYFFHRFTTKTIDYSEFQREYLFLLKKIEGRIG